MTPPPPEPGRRASTRSWILLGLATLVALTVIIALTWVFFSGVDEKPAGGATARSTATATTTSSPYTGRSATTRSPTSPSAEWPAEPEAAIRAVIARMDAITTVSEEREFGATHVCAAKMATWLDGLGPTAASATSSFATARITARAVSVDGEHATAAVDYTSFGETTAQEARLVREGGRWKFCGWDDQTAAGRTP